MKLLTTSSFNTLLFITIISFSSIAFSSDDPRDRMATLIHNTYSFEYGKKVDDCALKEFGYGVINNPIIIEGSYASGYSSNTCSVSIKKQDFEKVFNYCHLSGISFGKKQTVGNQFCTFRYMSRHEAYVFETDRDMSCEYTCIKK